MEIGLVIFDTSHFTISDKICNLTSNQRLSAVFFWNVSDLLLFINYFRTPLRHTKTSCFIFFTLAVTESILIVAHFTFNALCYKIFIVYIPNITLVFFTEINCGIVRGTKSYLFTYLINDILLEFLLIFFIHLIYISRITPIPKKH